MYFASSFDRPFVAGLAMILAVCVIWTFSSVLVQRVEHERVSPMVLTYACNALFVVYLVPRLARRRGDAAPRARRDTTMSPARGGLALAPLWVGAQLLYNASLARTSVSSSTALSSTGSYGVPPGLSTLQHEIKEAIGALI